MHVSFERLSMVLLLSIAALQTAAAEPSVTFTAGDHKLSIAIDGKPLADYVWRDEKILRPYFAHVRAPNGMQVSRNHPPREGLDPTDHDTMHPGIWLAFGDISGNDFWRNKATVEQIEFVEQPAADAQGGHFAVRNRYRAGDKTICEEVRRIHIGRRPGGYLILWSSEFRGDEEFYFGDQEELGLGFRVATPMTVKNGGQIANSDGLKYEKQVWGKQADWCDFSGTIDGALVGMMLMPDPKNFRRSWFHARDYGFLTANPFGENAFTKGPKSRVVVKKGDTLRLGFGVLIHSGIFEPAAAYKDYLRQVAEQK